MSTSLPVSTLASSRQRIITAVRVRPPNTKEIESKSNIIVFTDPSVDTNTCNLLDPLYFKTDPTKVDSKAYGRYFSYDHMFFSIPGYPIVSNQEDVYNKCGRPLVFTCIDGYNCCLIAYGQTGSGK